MIERKIFFSIFIIGLCTPILGSLFPIDIQSVIEPFFTLNDSQLSSISGDLAKQFSLPAFTSLNQSSLTEIFKTLTTLPTTIPSLSNPISVSTFLYNVQKALQNTGLCALCQLVVALFQLDDVFLPIILQIVCTLYMTLSTQSIASDFCTGIINLNLPSLRFVKKNSQILDPQLACSILLQNNQCRFNKPALSWTAKASTQAKILPSATTVGTCQQPLQFLHLTDFHVSMTYKEGSSADCGYPVCCIDGLGNTAKGGKAGKWGDYYCDVAPSMYDSALKYISQNHQNLTAIFFTGDVVDHLLWNTTIKTNLETMEFAFSKIKEYFPTTPVFPVLGNHESQPSNVFAPFGDEKIIAAGLDQQWLYDSTAELWSPWLSAPALETFQKYGYYAQNFTSSLKIIGLNSNLCYCFNWYLWYNTTFLEGHLDWLTSELEESERNGQKVYIVGHNSMGNGECIEPWEKSYNAIVVRFAHIILAQLVGHTHTDEMKIFYDSDNNPVNVAWNGGSLTTFQFYNPNYKIMNVCPDTWVVDDIDTYIFNMTEANLSPNQDPTWKLLYSMKKDYNMSDLSPESYDALCDRMASDNTVLEQYWRYYVRDGDPSLKTGCDAKCSHEMLCRMPKTLTYSDVKPYCNSKKKKPSTEAPRSSPHPSVEYTRADTPDSTSGQHKRKHIHKTTIITIIIISLFFFNSS